MTPSHHQLSSIHALMLHGQRPLRIYRHTLLLWGGAAGLLCAITEPLIRAMNLGFNWQIALTVLAILGPVFAGTAWIDRWLTRRHVQKHDLTISFAQEQITKVWWLLVAIGVLLTSGMTLNGGDTLVYGLWIAIFGIGLFIHGAFSEELPEWVGVGMLLLGAVPLALQAPFQQTRWLAVCAFGIGLPVLSLMLDGGQQKPFARRLLQSMIWLSSVLAPAIVLYQMTLSDGRASLDKIALSAPAPAPPAGRYALSLPVGTVIPLDIALDGFVMSAEGGGRLNLVLKQPVDIEMLDGEPTGFYQTAGSSWLNFNESLQIHAMKFSSRLSAGAQPTAKVNIKYSIDRRR